MLVTPEAWEIACMILHRYSEASLVEEGELPASLSGGNQKSH